MITCSSDQLINELAGIALDVLPRSAKRTKLFQECLAEVGRLAALCADVALAPIPIIPRLAGLRSPRSMTDTETDALAL